MAGRGPPWFERVMAEARAVRERAGSSTSLVRQDRGGRARARSALLQRVSANDVDRPVGSVVYTQWCDERGGMVADVTVTRLADDRFRVVTGAGYLASEMSWLRAHTDHEDGAVTIRDVSADLTTIGVWGPQARDVVVAAGARADEVGNDAIPMRRAGVHMAPRPSMPPESAMPASSAGSCRCQSNGPSSSGIDSARPARGPIGYRAIESLRMEKGYRYYGTDLTMQDTPFDAGMGAFVRLAKGPFIGRDALVQAHSAEPVRRLRTLVIGATDYEPIYGGEAVRLDGEVVSRLRSVAYGPTIERRSATPTYRHRRRRRRARDRRVRPACRRYGRADVSVDPSGDRMRG